MRARIERTHSRAFNRVVVVAASAAAFAAVAAAAGAVDVELATFLANIRAKANSFYFRARTRASIRRLCVCACVSGVVCVVVVTVLCVVCYVVGVVVSIVYVARV